MEKFIQIVRNLDPDILFIAIFGGIILTLGISVVALAIYLLGIWLLLPLAVFIGASTMIYVITSGDFVPYRKERK